MKKLLGLVALAMSCMAYTVFADGDVYLKNEYYSYFTGEVTIVYKLGSISSSAEEHYVRYGETVKIGSLKSMKLDRFGKRYWGLDLSVRWSGAGSSFGAPWNEVALQWYGRLYHEDSRHQGKDLLIHYGYTSVTFEWI